MTENEAIRDLEYLIEEYSAYPPETGVNETIGSLQYCITALREIQQYREIGTVEECREAVEKQKAKNPVKDKYHHNCCPNCGWIVSGEGGYGEEFCPHCENCGQAIRWVNENLEGMEDENT